MELVFNVQRCVVASGKQEVLKPAAVEHSDSFLLASCDNQVPGGCVAIRQSNGNVLAIAPARRPVGKLQHFKAGGSEPAEAVRQVRRTRRKIPALNRYIVDTIYGGWIYCQRAVDDRGFISGAVWAWQRLY